jgi:phosphoesterase RecJ-like protein
MDRDLGPKFKKLSSLLKGAKNIIIASHNYPDGDALGSVLALFLALKKKGLKVVPYLRDVPPNFDFMRGYSEIKKVFPAGKFDFLIGLDYGDFKRLGVGSKKIPDEKIITIDHHLPSDHRGVLQIVKPDFSSASEIIYYFFKKSGIQIDQDIAECLLTGIYTDTGGFKHAATSFKTLRAASDLMSRGASLLQIIRKTTTMESLTILKIWGKILSKIKQDKKTGMIYSWISRKELNGGVSENLSVGDLAADISMRSGAPFTLVLVEDGPGEFRGSLRSEAYCNVDVSKIARALGGGGHKLSAGFEKKGDLEEIINEIRKAALKKK